MLSEVHKTQMQIVITGASKGIGRALTEIFAKDNRHRIFICARRKEELTDLKKTLLASFPKTEVETKVADMGSKEEVERFADFILMQTTTIDILINNAGLFMPGNIYDEEPGAIEKMLQVNLLGAYYLTRKLLPLFMAQKSGSIFNICSIAALHSYQNGSSYSISKYALAGFTNNLRAEMKPFGVKVCGVYPGPTYTSSWEGAPIAPERIMQPRDIAKMVYAATDLSEGAVVEDIILQPQAGLEKG